jgi:hypothetical protein
MHPVVNIEDPVGKVVGKRRPPSRLVVSPQETAANRQWATTAFSPRNKKMRLQVQIPRGGRPMADGPFDPETGELISRDPSVEDLVSLCRELSYARGIVPPQP